MDPLEAIVLGIIQGATEFLPISSSGHLLLVPSLLGWSEPNLNAIAIAHLGTLLAVLVYFRSDLSVMAKAMAADIRVRKLGSESGSRLGWLIIAGSIPAAIAGLLIADWLDAILGRPEIAAALLIGTAVILLIGERVQKGSRSVEALTLRNVFIIGLAQVLALLPGISRSGVTISAGLGQDLDRAAAARFSFLLGIPAIAGAGLLSTLDLLQDAPALEQIGPLAAIMVVSGLVGYGCIHFLLSWLRRRTLLPFALYCATFGSLFLAISWLRLA